MKHYAEHVADKYDLHRHIRHDTSVIGARWDEIGQFWTLEIAEQPSITARIVIVATGILSQPKTPNIPGLQDYQGALIHTSRWPKVCDLAGKRVAFIGTGATAVQAIPEVAKTAAQVSVYQRTPIWVTPKPDLPIPPLVRRLFRVVPATQKAARAANGVFIAYIAAGSPSFGRRRGFCSPWSRRPKLICGCRCTILRYGPR